MTTEATRKLNAELAKAIKALAKEMTQTDDMELQADIAEQMSTLMNQRTKLTRRILKNETGPYKSALKALQELTQEAKDAKKDVDKIEKMIKKASGTADKVTQFIGGLAKVAALV